MTTFVLVPGAGGVAGWYWSRVADLLQQAGHEAIPVELPGDDDTAGLPEYVDLVVDAIGERRGVVLVAQSLGGFTTPLVAQRADLRAIVLVNAMIPGPGEKADDWWSDVDSESARVAAAERNGYSPEFDLDTYFLHDVPADIAAEGASQQRNETNRIFEAPCEYDTWPNVATHVVAGADDRFFPAEFQQRVARERLGVEADVLPGGHLIALSQPKSLAEYLLAV
ncbi:MAG TPA: alpha/beta hydrolase [Jatrophihabitantaceae bacterium]|nr:alpha/beta hydrolase [Jatrophihabitantaceae bacterium]